MTTLYTVDFKNKLLVSKRAIEDDGSVLPDQISLDKLQYFSQLVNEGMTLVRFNTRYEGVQIPSYLKNELSAALNWSHKYKVEDFAYDEDGVRGTLSFDRKLCFTDLPWPCVWGISLADGRKKREWKESIPKEIYFDGE